MSHTCPALVVSCIDFRLHQALHDWLRQQYGHFDVVHLAGGARTLLQPATAPVVLDQIALSAKLHGIKTVVLVNHWDCGAYGGSAGFANDTAKERTQYETDLRAAAKLVQAKQPELTVVTALELLNGSVETIELK